MPLCEVLSDNKHHNIMQKIELNRIRVILEEKGISQTWLANKLGKSFSMVNAYTCNRRQPNLETLYQIANILNVNVKDLLNGNE